MTVLANTHPDPDLLDPRLGHAAGTAGYRRILAATFAAGLATFVLLYDTQALLPEFVDAFGVTPTQATLTMSLPTAALAVTLLVAGPVSEAWGRTRLIRWSVWLAGLIALACAVAPSWHALLGLRLLSGIALAGLPAAAMAYLREELHPGVQARAAGLYIGGTALGGMAGRMVTAPIADLAGWRWALAAAAGFALVCAAVVTVALPDSRGFVPVRLTRTSWAEMVRSALRDPVLLALYVIGGCALGSLVATFNALGFRLTAARFALSLAALSLLYLVFPLGSLSAAMAGRAADRVGRRAVLPIGVVVAFVGIALVAVPSLPAIVVGLAALTMGFFVVHGLASGWVAARAHAAGASVGQAAAFYTCFYYVGSSVFGNLGSTMWTHAGWTGVTALSASLMAVCAVLTLTLRRLPAVG